MPVFGIAIGILGRRLCVDVLKISVIALVNLAVGL